MPEIATQTIRCDGGLPAFLAIPADMPAGTDKVPAIVFMMSVMGS